MSDTLQASLDEQRRRSAEKRPPEVNAAIARVVRWLQERGFVDRALGVGDSAPDFSLPSARGRTVPLADLLRRGPVVLAFYRGGW